MQKNRRNGRITCVEDEIAHLRGLDLRGLQARWQSVFGRPAGRKLLGFGPDTAVPEIPDQFVDAAKFEVASVDRPDQFSLLFDNGNAAASRSAVARCTTS